MSKAGWLLFVMVCAWPLAPAAAQTQPGPVRIGVLSDFSGPYAGLAGEGSVVAARMAVEDCLKAECAGMKIDVLTADHQNKPDLALAIARRWIDQEGVTALTDLVNASVQLAIQGLVREKDRVALFPGGTTRLINDACSPGTSVMWMWDTYSQVAALATSLTHDGTRWFFVTADYAFGHALQSDATAIVRARGGQVVGSVLHPFPGTSDFSSYLLQAQASGAGLIGLANAGADVQTAIKQAREFGVGGDGSGQQLAAFVVFAPDVQSLGLDVARGITVTEGFFYGLDERTRAWAARFMAAYGHGLPSQIHAGVYSATLHYLRAVAAAHTTDTAAVIRAMHGLPIQDDVVRNATLRPDGRMVHDYYVFRVKAPVASSGPNDIYELVATIPGDQAFRPLSASACPAIADAAK